MAIHQLKWICIFLITSAILGWSNQKIKEEIEDVVFGPANQEEKTLQQKPAIKGINWHTSFDKGLKVAKKEGKPLMVDFGAEWCGWCKKLDATTYKDPEVIALSKKFVPVKIDCNKDRITPRNYGVRGLPTIVFMNSEGQMIHQIVGYRGPKDFALEMKKCLQRIKRCVQQKQSRLKKNLR